LDRLLGQIRVFIENKRIQKVNHSLHIDMYSLGARTGWKAQNAADLDRDTQARVRKVL
jgi:hypothetical protein